MPIYEYLCPACNRVYSFMARSAAGSHEPVCPRCGAADLVKQVSRFAFVRGGTSRSTGGGAAPGGREPFAGDEPFSGDDPYAGDGPRFGGGGPSDDMLDDPRVEREMMRLMRDAESLDENDPRQVAQFMRRMSALTGEPLDSEMEDAVRRLEAGEDVEKIEEEYGDLLGGGPGDDFGGPSYDEGLYPM